MNVWVRVWMWCVCLYFEVVFAQFTKVHVIQKWGSCNYKFVIRILIINFNVSFAILLRYLVCCCCWFSRFLFFYFIVKTQQIQFLYFCYFLTKFLELWLWRVVAEKWYEANDCNTFLYWESVSFALWKSFRSNKFASWVCFTIVFVCVCVFVWHQKLCSSHCQSQITNDTNSPRALTISTLARSPSLHDTHTHKHAGTHSIVHSLSNSLARSHTHIVSQPKGGSTTQKRNETKNEKRNPKRAADQSR